MKAILRIAGEILAAERWSLARGTALAIVVLAFGVALLGLSGWFITAAGMAGLAGIGIAFDVFRPSAGVRFLALGRTAARYGERMLTHDATLRSLTTLRVRLLRALTRRMPAETQALRASEQLNRLTLDVDALDGIALRLLIPMAAGTLTLVAAFAMLWWLTDPVIALWLAASFAAGTLAALGFVLVRSRAPSRIGRRGLDALRMRMIDLLRARATLTMAGRMTAQRGIVLSADRRQRAAAIAQDRIERGGALALSLAQTVAAAGVLVLGATLVRSGTVDAALAALGFFAALALAETVAPLRRGFAEYGRMADAAQRVWTMLDAPANEPSRTPPASIRPLAANSRALEFDNIGFRYGEARAAVLQDFRLTVSDGEIVALTGPSGGGKSTLLHIAAGFLPSHTGAVTIDGVPLRDIPEAQLRAMVGLLPQRSVLMSGTIRDTLALGRPDLSEQEAWAVLKAIALDDVVAARGGLDSRLGESGSGLSGGESRRLALARALVRRPPILLLDEPTEGLDRETADAVLAGMRRLLPDATILIASHREAERVFADRIVAVGDKM